MTLFIKAQESGWSIAHYAQPAPTPLCFSLDMKHYLNRKLFDNEFSFTQV